LNTQKYLDWHSEIKLEEGLKKLMKNISWFYLIRFW
jgi:hypothetical protein